MAIEATVDEAPKKELEVADAVDALKKKEGADLPDTGDEKPDEKPETTVDSLAQELGHKPKDEFQGHEDDYVDAAEYIRRSKDIQDSMRKHLKENKRKLGAMDQTIKDIKTHYDNNTKVEASRNQKRLAELRVERDEAIEEADKKKVDTIESEMADLYETASRAMQKDDIPEPDPEEVEEFLDWHKDNPWYRLKGTNAGDVTMAKYADKLSDLPENRALPNERRLKVVTELVKKAYPEKFKPKKSPPAKNLVEGAQGPGGKRQFTAKDLSSEQRKTMNNFVTRGIMTEKKYINDLAEIGELT